jgi:hypothetical protein
MLKTTNTPGIEPGLFNYFSTRFTTQFRQSSEDDKHVFIDVKSCNLAEPTYSLFCVDFVIGINTQPQYLLFLQN